VPLPLGENSPAASTHNQPKVPLILTDPAGQFASNYNRHHFQFPHGLKDHPLFELSSLVELARRMPDHRDTYWSNGKVDVSDPWTAGQEHRLSLADTIAHIEDNNSLVLLKHTEQDQLYGPLFKEFLARVVEYSGDQMRRDVAAGEILILISSPNRITPYHMDGECNYVVQVVGNKTLSVFDQNDQTLVSAKAIEQYHAVDISSIKYDKDRQADAALYELNAGTGVHIPLWAPHWVRNHNNVSIALSVTYELFSVQRETRICRLNNLLRKAGFTPTPPGVSPWRDQLKLAAMDRVIAARNLVKPKPAPAYPVWTPSST
jgi:hypothetical protein